MTKSADVIDFLSGRLSGDGLFVELGESHPTVEAARFGLEALALTGRELDNVAEATRAFLGTCQRDEGGFSMSRGDANPALSATYYALRLHDLGLIPGLLQKPERVSNWIRGQIFTDLRVTPDMDIDELYCKHPVDAAV